MAVTNQKLIYKTQFITTHSNVKEAGYTATKVVCGWAGAIFEVTRSFGQEQ